MPKYAPCPECENTTATPVGFTWWGGIVGPKLLSHVKCAECGAAYNGKTGKSNNTAIGIYLGVSVLIGLVLAVVIAISNAS